MTTRRNFLRTAATGMGAWMAANAVSGPIHAAPKRKPSKDYIGCNQYVWISYLRRDKRNFLTELEAGIAEVGRCGADGLEVMVNGPETIDQFVPLLKKNGLGMRSIYSNLVLHTPEDTEAEIEKAIESAKLAVEFGTEIYVVNPAPLRGEGSELGKTDAELRCQADAMNRLGRQLNKLGVTLAYHYHAPAFEHGAREFHHTMLNTDEANMTICLDAHWVFRGSSDSEAAVFDMAKLYGHRVSEVHMRQSQDGIWTETFGPGDIDYPKLLAYLADLGVDPLLVLEQASEAGTPQTMTALEAISASAVTARKMAR